jgi:50S ribosomal protein L16 3-hydroxylase
MISFGKLNVEQFKAKHWQKKPLLVRAALATPEALISTQDLLTLSQNGRCEARLITRSKNNAWQLSHGPFNVGPSGKSPFPKKSPWTVLVQGVDTVNQPIHELMCSFRFAGDALLDDVMISYASDGGGVGPHLDSYDVFLIQLHGSRQWRISPPKGTSPEFEESLPVKILKSFTPTQEWLLEPGDMIYLPAGWGHDGVAVGACMTASVGFRAPSRNEWLNAYLDDLSDSLEDILSPTPKRLKLPPTKTPQPNKRPAQLNSAIPEQFGNWVDELMGKGVAQKPATKAHVRELAGRFLTDPKNQTTFSIPAKPISELTFKKRLVEKGVRLSLASRCLYSKAPSVFFLNGESFSVSANQLKVLARLADEKLLLGSGLEPNALDTDLIESLYQWYENGWISIL